MRHIALLGVAAIALLATTAASAHGPCTRNLHMQPCLVPNSGPPGSRVTIEGTVAYQVVWNDIAECGGGPNGYKPRSRTIALLKIRRARSGVHFKVPKVPAGRYVVIIYDGAEGGGHCTWNLFRVTRPG